MVNEDSMDQLFPVVALVGALLFVYAVATSRSSKARDFSKSRLPYAELDLSLQLSHIPSIGPSGPFTSYWGFLRFMLKPREVITEGYQKVSIYEAIRLLRI
jgi:hypothetical protein